MTTPKVEIGFDLSGSGTGPFFILDSSTQGVLDNTSFTLGGEFFYDVTNDVRSIAIQRGKNRILDEFDAGLANIVFDNRNRDYDPLYISSPYATQIIPKRKLRVTVNDEPVFFGLIDDWNFNYDISGDSTASAAASDVITGFSQTALAAGTSTVQTSGARVNAILDNANIAWPATTRNIDTGGMTLGADVIESDTNALDYFRTIEKSEPGLFFIGKDGYVNFRDRNVAPTSTNTTTFADDGSGIPYYNLRVQYGSELLHNQVILSSAITASTAIAFDDESIGIYGYFTLNQSGLLVNDDADLTDLAVFLASKYSAPEYRFEALEIFLNDLSAEERSDLLALELGDPVSIKFTPNGVAPQILKYAQVIRIDHSIDPEVHTMSLGFATLDFTSLVLDDAIFGKLDSGNRLAL